MILWMSVVWAAELYINPGEDWCTAVNAASPGDTIFLVDGDHAGPCAIRASGTMSDPITLRGDGTLPAVVYSGNSSNVIDVEASHVQVIGVWIGPTNPNIDAIKIKSGDHVRVEGCRFDQVGGISVAANSTDSAGIQLIDNTFTDLQATGIYLGCHDGGCRASDYLIEGNVIDGVVSSGVGYGMEMKLNSWGTARHNVVSDTQGPGIEVFGSEGADLSIVEGNLVDGSTNNAAIEIGGGPAIVRNNIVFGGTEGGVYAYDYGGRGLQRDVALLGNTVIGDSGAAIRVSGWDSGTGLEVANNAAWQRSGSGPAIPSPVGSATIENNLACDASCWVDVDAWDFDPTTALQGAGVAHPELTVDFCDRMRPASPALGALEPDGPGPLSIARWPGYACGDGGPTTGGTTTGDPTSPPPSTGSGEGVDPNTPAEPESHCGCSTAPSLRGLSWLAVILVLRRRPRFLDRNPSIDGG